VIPDLNPDGVAAGTRQNAHGVDLNRNFPFRWQPIGGPGNEFYSGPSALSEPESGLAAGLIRRLHPEISVWFHQQDAVVDESGGAVGIERRYAGLVGLPLRRLTRFPGSATGWENHLRPGSTAFVVELPAGSLTPAASGIYAGAILRLLPGSGAAGAHPFPRPPIVWKPVPFGPARRSETAAYAERHYGIRTWRLVEPRVIVEHLTGGTSFGSAWNTFAANGPDLGELPGTCAHFIVDTDGTIYQLAPLSVMCRHTVGLNWTAIGIEDVATSDAQVLHHRRQLAASLRLTLWLMQRFHVAIRNVIGHNESLSSPFHFELFAGWRCQTHSDWTPGDMRTYRLLLAELAARHGVSVGSRSRVAPTTC